MEKSWNKGRKKQREPYFFLSVYTSPWFIFQFRFQTFKQNTWCRLPMRTAELYSWWRYNYSVLYFYSQIPLAYTLCASFLFPNSPCLCLFCIFVENEGIRIFSLPKLCCLCSTRRIIPCRRWTHGTWNHHLCYPWCNVRYTNLIIWYRHIRYCWICDKWRG